jgi:hypothetical protein
LSSLERSRLSAYQPKAALRLLLTDFSPVLMFASAANLLVVHPSVTCDARSGTLIALAKSHSGQLNFASNGFGS